MLRLFNFHYNFVTVVTLVTGLISVLCRSVFRKTERLFCAFQMSDGKMIQGSKSAAEQEDHVQLWSLYPGKAATNSLQGALFPRLKSVPGQQRNQPRNDRGWFLLYPDDRLSKFHAIAPAANFPFFVLKFFFIKQGKAILLIKFPIHFWIGKQTEDLSAGFLHMGNDVFLHKPASNPFSLFVFLALRHFWCSYLANCRYTAGPLISSFCSSQTSERYLHRKIMMMFTKSHFTLRI